MSSNFQVTGCFIVLQLWIHPILLHLLPIPIAYSLIKRGIEKFGSASDQVRELRTRIKISVSEWLATRADVVIPSPARFVWRELARLKKAVLQGMNKKTAQGSSMNGVTILRGGDQTFCDGNTKALILKGVTMREGGQKLFEVIYG